MFFRTQRTLSENILMIFDPLPVKFLPQKKLLVWAKNSLIFCSKLPRSQKWRYQEFLLHQKMAKEGSKNQKKIFFQKKYSKDGKKNFGTSGTIFAQNRFWGSGGGVRPTVTSLCCRSTSLIVDQTVVREYKIRYYGESRFLI